MRIEEEIFFHIVRSDDRAFPLDDGRRKPWLENAQSNGEEKIQI